MKVDNSRLYFFILFIISGVFVFSELTKTPIQLWDESRLAMNALEMSQNGNILVTYFEGSPDMWNTKPPLAIWSMVLSMKFLGYNELAVRLPSAIASLCTILFIYYIVLKKTQAPLAAFCSGLVLLSSIGFMDFHVTRTGDYDALLTLWITIYSFCYYEFLSDDDLKPSLYLLGFFFFFVLAMLTKGIAGAMMLPALFLYTLVSKNFIRIIKDKRIYIFGILSIVLVLSYYFLREAFNEGYLKAVNENEIGGRFGKVNEEHLGPFSFYWDYFILKRYIPWIYILPLSGIILFFEKNSSLRKLAFYSALCALIFIFIISSSKTKLNWYDAPSFPFMAIITGSGIASIISILLSQRSNIQHSKIIELLAVFIIFYMPFNNLSKAEIYKNNPETIPTTNYRKVLDEIVKTKPELKSFYVIQDDYDASLSFYQRVYKMNGFQLTKNTVTEYLPNESIVLTLSPNNTDAIASMYNVEPLMGNDSYSLVKIKSEKGISLAEVEIERQIARLNSTPQSRNYIRQKALQHNIPYQKALIGDAFYLVKNRMNISPEEERKIIEKYNQ